MSEEDYKAILAVYQQKSFELFNSNVMMETQIAKLQQQIQELQREVCNGNPIPENGSDDF